jgi:hypothetical protein
MCIELSICRDPTIKRKIEKPRRSKELYRCRHDESDIDECDDECECRGSTREEYYAREDDESK